MKLLRSFYSACRRTQKRLFLFGLGPAKSFTKLEWRLPMESSPFKRGPNDPAKLWLAYSSGSFKSSVASSDLSKKRAGQHNFARRRVTIASQTEIGFLGESFLKRFVGFDHY